MNKNILMLTISVLFTTNHLFAQKKYPEGILGLKWGDTIEKVNKVMHTKKDVRFYTYQEKMNSLLIMLKYLEEPVF